MLRSDIAFSSRPHSLLGAERQADTVVVGAMDGAGWKDFFFYLGIGLLRQRESGKAS